MSSFCAVIVSIALFIGLPISVIWFIVSSVRKKKLRSPIISMSTCMLLTIVFTILGTISWMSTDEYKQYMKEKEIEISAKKEKERDEELEKLKEQKDSEEKEQTEKKSDESSTDNELNSQVDEKETETQSISTQKEETEVVKPENIFLSDLKNVMDDKVAQKAYEILKNKIGFSELEYKNQLDGTTNYEISADGYDVVVTASDDVYRVFIPNSSYTFYEDGKVKMTVSELEARTIDSNARNRYYII